MTNFISCVLGTNIVTIPEHHFSTSSLIKKVFGESNFYALRQQSCLCRGNKAAIVGKNF